MAGAAPVAQPAGQAHILVIPSEEYVPSHAPLAGIFQKNQVDALRRSNRYRLGVLSVRLEHSWPMYVKAMAYRLAGRRTDNVLGSLGLGQLAAEFLRRARRRGVAIEASDGDGVNLVRATGLYLLPPYPAMDARWWIAAGLAGYRRYVAAFGRPDLVHAHNALNAGLLAARIQRRYGVPYVLTEHSSYFHQGLAPKSLDGAVRAAIEKARSHTVVSATLRRSLEARLGPIRTSSDVLPNVLPAAFEDGVRALARPPGATFTVLAVGSFLPVKGHEHLLRAFARFHARRPGSRLRLAGEGPLRGKLEALALALGVDRATEFLGEVSADRVREEMAAADVLALPSLYETFGVVLIEAMACGLPIVATRCGGPDDLVCEDAGWLVEPADPLALADGLEQAYLQGGRRDRAKIRARCIAHYGREAFTRRAAELYEAALHE